MKKRMLLLVISMVTTGVSLVPNVFAEGKTGENPQNAIAQNSVEAIRCGREYQDKYLVEVGSHSNSSGSSTAGAARVK